MDGRSNDSVMILEESIMDTVTGCYIIFIVIILVGVYKTLIQVFSSSTTIIIID